MPFGSRDGDGMAGAPERPDRLQLGPPPRASRVWSVSVNGLLILASLYTLAAARDFLLPLVVGVLVYFLLMPVVRSLKRFGIPESIGAAVVVLGLMATVGLGLYALSWPAASWAARAPDSVRRVESKLRPLMRRMQKVTQTAEQMESITAGATPAATEVKVQEPSMGASFLAGIQSFLGGALIVLTLVYFLLASGDSFLRKIVRALPRLQDRKRAVDIAQEMERQISSYLLFITVANFTFGAVVAASMWLLGMPNAVLWGVVAAVTNFVPYLGGIVCTLILGLAALLTFDNIWRALLVPGVFSLLNILEGYVITPIFMGKRFTLNPAVLFVGLLFWYFVWGAAGALLAVPMMAAFKIFCERVESLQGLAEFLGGDDPGPADMDRLAGGEQTGAEPAAVAERT